MQFFLHLAIFVILATSVESAFAGERATPMLMGALGLNTIPSARMDKQGTVHASLSTLDPYLHAAVGFQIADPLYIGIRQSAEISNIKDSADRLFPGIDLRLKLWDENEYRPAAALGLQSALGHRRMAGEYLSFSKRYKDFDFTGGMAWGRLGSAAHMENPLKHLHHHFGKRRLLDGEEPNQPNNWFTGEDVGFFAGAEYFSPHIDGLSVKADWGADRYIVEQSLSDYDPPDPWALGINFTPVDFVNIAATLIGGEKLMGQITLKSPLQKWFGRKHKKNKPHHMRPYRTGPSLPAEMVNSATRNNIRLYETRRDDYSASTMLLLDHNRPLPMQIGRAARHMGNHAGEVIEELRITPLSYGLEGSSISLQRRDLEQALAHKQGSPQEIWRNAAFYPAANGKDLLHDRFNAFDYHTLRFVLDNQISLSEEDSGLLYRTAFILEETRKLSEHFWLGGALRFDLKDNLHKIRDFRPQVILPVRSNIDSFAQRTLSLDRSFISWMTTVKPDLHVSLTGGYLEEMYAGLGGEVLYRPFGKRFAIGMEAYQVFKRDPFTDFNLGFNGDRLLTGHLQAWYEIPDTYMTIQARIGRYLAEDFGGTLALQRRFKNGVKMEAFVTATNNADFDVFGSTTHLYSGLKLNLPLGQIKHIPEGSEVRITAAPLGRDAGQSLDTPIKLYDISEPFSTRHIAQHWTSVVD